MMSTTEKIKQLDTILTGVYQLRTDRVMTNDEEKTVSDVLKEVLKKQFIVLGKETYRGER
jgi:hypothetical protein